MNRLHPLSRPKTTPTKNSMWGESGASPNRKKALYPMYQIARLQKEIDEHSPVKVPRHPKRVPPTGYSGNPDSPRYAKDSRLAHVQVHSLETTQMYHELAGAALGAGTRRRTKVNRCSLVMQEVSPSVLEEAAFDSNELSTFFRLSQITGFSKARLAGIFEKWSAVTRHEDMSFSQFSPWMKSLGFDDNIVVEQLFHAFDEDGGGSISFPECTIGLSFVLSRDIKLPQFQVGSNQPEFWEIAFRFFDRDAKGVVDKVGVTKLIMAALKVGCRQSSEYADQLLALISPGDHNSTNVGEFGALGSAIPEVYRFFRQVLQIQNKASSSLEFQNGKARALRHLKNAVNGIDEGNEPMISGLLDGVGSDVVSNLLPTWTPQATAPAGIGA